MNLHRDVFFGRTLWKDIYFQTAKYFQEFGRDIIKQNCDEVIFYFFVTNEWHQIFKFYPPHFPHFSFWSLKLFESLAMQSLPARFVTTWTAVASDVFSDPVDGLSFHSETTNLLGFIYIYLNCRWSLTFWVSFTYKHFGLLQFFISLFLCFIYYFKFLIQRFKFIHHVRA